MPQGDSASAQDRSGLVAAELVRAQYRNIPTAVSVNAVIAALLCIALQETVPLERLGWWLLVVYVVAAIRFLVWLRFHSASLDDAVTRMYRRLAVAGSGVNGLVWGAGGIILYASHSPASQFLLLITQFGMGAGAAYASAPAFAAVMAYLLPSVLLSSVPFFMEGDSVHVTLGTMLFVFVAAATHFTYGISRTIARAIALRFENLELIHELRNQTLAAEQAREAAEEANVAKSRFLAAAGHDLRQPLHALGFFVDALQEQSLAADGRAVVTNIRRSVDAMEDLFNSLLDVSRLDAGIVRPRVATIALSPLMERVRVEFEPAAAQKQLSLRVRRNSLFVRSDPVLLERVMRNLVSNAVRYTDRGKIVLGARRVGGMVRIEVWDSGRGIPKDKHREIFQEFRQLDNPQRDRRKGLGLGLAIVERLVKLLDHPLELTSQPGKGSVFAVTVPRGRREEFVPGEADGQIVVDRDVANSLILVVDDELDVRESMSALLRRWHCEVVAAESCEDMLHKLVSVQRIPDLIVSDYRLNEGENGIEVVARLREEFNAQVPALLITGDTGIEQLIEAEESGLHVLHKPLNPSRLRALIANLRRERIRAA
ncbi:MAG: hybrid sensor histidine kinase/response regulator [Proteobacteria bacterium]|nr:hybrid sensor histidine kinase/response regulator [Pseudomonadota bacterium]